MTIISLRPVTVHNWKECAFLKLAPDQEGFVPGNLYSIAEAQFYPDARSLAIYNTADELVGYALYGRDVFTGSWKVFRLMIDVAHQRKGYGNAAMQNIITEIAGQPAADPILICYQNHNEVARKLYARLGFVEQEVDANGRVTAVLQL